MACRGIVPWNTIGTAWNSKEWSSMPWNTMEWHGIAWTAWKNVHGIHVEYGLRMYGLSWNVMEYIIEYYGTSWNIMDYNGISWNIKEYQGISWNPMEYQGILWNHIVDSYGAKVMQYSGNQGISRKSEATPFCHLQEISK